MNELVPDISRLQKLMAQMPQVELETSHYFANGMYCRSLFRYAGTVIVGKTHKHEHFYIVAKGKVIVFTDGESKEYSAGTILVSKPGTKRAVYALEDSLCLTVHRTDQIDVEAIEQEIIIPDDGPVLFDARNELKMKELT